MILTEVEIPKGASRIDWVDANQRIDFTVVLAPKTAIPDLYSAGRAQVPIGANVGRSSSAPFLTHAELRQMYGADAVGAELVGSFARRFGLEVKETAELRRSMRLRGRAVDVGRAFETRFEEFELGGDRFFAPAQPLRIPEKWNGAVEAILGLHGSGRTLPRRTSVVHGRGAPGRLDALARAYGFPSGQDGSGETMGLIEFGGGFEQEDLAQFCAAMGIATPKLTVVEIAGGANRPASRRAIHQFLDVLSGTAPLTTKAEESDWFEAAQCTVEVTMDLQVMAALAPGAHIVVYFAAGDEQGLYHAISHAVHDEQHRPGILSISWSVPEQKLPKPELHAIEGVLREAAHLGMTICTSSGDGGALNGSPDGKPSVNYPASSPHCLACGGTSGRMNGAAFEEEVVWNATHYGVKGASGGGVSDHFPLPPWQKDAGVPVGPEGYAGRGVPDVAGLADPRYGCELLIAGRTFTSAGTSAVAPMWAALIARFNQALGRRCGHLHPHLYRAGKERENALHPVLKGHNGFYSAGEGWNACTGYGTPRGKELLLHLERWLKG